jgi:geranylgeranyl pyrophosphate synthase
MTDTYPDVAREIAARADAHMAQFIETYDLPANLRDAIRYSVLGGGKRLRPVLTLLSCRAVGGDDSLALTPAAALEFIHAFSLVHDDLPAMDDDDMRRGRPTLHIHAGEAMAVLAGDAMTSLAFAMIHGDPLLQPTLAHHLSRELAAATTDMIAGQVYDTLGGFDPDLSDTEKLHTIHRNKTGALIRAAFRMGALCGHADDHRLAQPTQLGEITGLMFQIVDDLLDVTQSLRTSRQSRR